MISKGAAQSWQMDNRGKTMLADKFDFGFAVDWMRKDLGMCLDEARAQRRAAAGDRAGRSVLRGDRAGWAAGGGTHRAWCGGCAEAASPSGRHRTVKRYSLEALHHRQPSSMRYAMPNLTRAGFTGSHWASPPCSPRAARRRALWSRWARKWTRPSTP